MNGKFLARLRVPYALGVAPLGMPVACVAMGCDCEFLCAMAGPPGCLLVAAATALALVAALHLVRELQLLAMLELREPRH
ncbi:MAG: hypothetical protein ACREIB_10855 [Pseudomonadota bacterium]